MAAAAVPPPVNVTTSTVNDLVFLDANEPLVLATPFLPWVPVAAAPPLPARVSLRAWQMNRTWLRRCGLSAAAADHLAFQSISMLNFRLTGAAWSRVLTEFVASDLLSKTFSDLRGLRLALGALEISAPASLVLLASDLDPGEDFDAPVVTTEVSRSMYVL